MLKEITPRQQELTSREPEDAFSRYWSHETVFHCNRAYVGTENE